MLKLLQRNMMKRMISWKTFGLLVICVGIMLSEYQGVLNRIGFQTVYMIVGGPLDVFVQVVLSSGSTLVATTILAIMIMVYIESPVINQDDRFFIMRTGKNRWLMVEILGIMCTSVAWIMLFNILGGATSANYIDWSDWGFNKNNLYCMIVYFLAFTCIGLFIMLFHLLNIKSVGTAVMVTLFLLEYFILDVLPNTIAAFDKNANTGKIIRMIKKFTFMNRMEIGYKSSEVVFSVVYFMVLIVILIGLNRRFVRKHEIG